MLIASPNVRFVLPLIIQSYSASVGSSVYGDDVMGHCVIGALDIFFNVGNQDAFGPTMEIPPTPSYHGEVAQWTQCGM